MRPWITLTSHINPSPEIWFEAEHFENLSFSGPRLKVLAVTSGPRIGPRAKFSWILEIWKVELTSTQNDEQNP